MILARPYEHHFSMNTANGKSDPLTEGQIDSLHMALDLSVCPVIVDMHILLCTKLRLLLVRFFLVCVLF